MTLGQIRLVQISFPTVMAAAEPNARLFYDRLFTLDPSARAAFRRTDMREQGRKLLDTLDAVVMGLGQLDAVMPLLRDLGARHGALGVTEEQYAAVGASLLWTLERALGPAFTPEVEAAWRAAYALVAGVMITGAREAA